MPNQSPDRLVHVIERSRDDERIHATVSTFKGAAYVSLRIFYRSGSDEWLPTKRGITVPAEQLSELENAVSALRAAIDGAPSPTSRPGRLERHRRARTEEPEPANSGRDARRRV